MLPKQRRTGLFSATQTTEVENLVRAGLRNPVGVTVKERVFQYWIFRQNVGYKFVDDVQRTEEQLDSRTPVNLENYYITCEGNEKLSVLIRLIETKGFAEKSGKFMVFMSTCAAVEYFSLVLKRSVMIGRFLRVICNSCFGIASLLPSIKLFCIHGKMKQNRYKIFDQFRTLGGAGILVTTDVMARGIDIAGIDWVIQFDPPSNAAAFVHRCGRTARIGQSGSAVVLLQPNEEAYIQFIDINQKVIQTDCSNLLLNH